MITRWRQELIIHRIVGLPYKNTQMNRIIFLILTSLLLINCDSKIKNETKPNNPEYSSEVEDRIENIVNNLQVATEVDGNFTSKTLVERMDHYHTPAVSIAVVNNGEN